MALNFVFDHLKTSGINEVEIEENFYWTVSEDQMFNLSLSKDQVELNVGSLVDDWEFSKDLLNREVPPATTVEVTK